MELHGEGGQDLLNMRSLSTVAEVSGATSLAYADGEGVQQPASCKYSMLRDTLFFLIPAPAGPDQEALPGAAAVTPKDNVSMVAGGGMINRPVTEPWKVQELNPSPQSGRVKKI